MAPPILILGDMHLTFGGTPLLEGIELRVSAGERLCVVGRNGSGKSTVLKLAAGLIEADDGTRFLQPGVSVRYLPQEPDFGDFKTVLDYAEAGLGPGDDPYRCRYLLEQLGVAVDADPAHLSGGEARRAALARVLAPEPDILLLDEPTNHLDLPAIEWLEKELSSMRSALVLISHDRRFLGNLSRSTVWISQGTARRLDKGFGAFEAWRDEILENEETDRHKLDRKIVREEHWLRHGVSARRKRNQGRLRDLFDLRDQRRTARRPTGSVKMAAAESHASGKRVIEAKGISKAYGDLTVVEDFSTRIVRGDRVGLVGPNGAGKTTLLNILIGEMAPDGGTVQRGAGLEMVALDQRRDSLDPDWTLADALTGGGGDMVSVAGTPRHVMSYMKDFLFSPEQARTPIGALSGGERGRLMLARAFAKPSNLMVLDEPTNDLDLETLDLLQELLADYAGTALLVSHDRDFIDRVVTSVIVSDGGGMWSEYPGGYSDMVSQRGKGIEAAEAKIEKTGAASVAGGPVGKKQKMSYKDTYALENLPARIEELHGEIEKLQISLADPELYRADPAAFDKTATALKTAQAGLATAEEDWLRLEMLKEEMGG